MKDQNGGASDTLRGFLSDVKASRLRCCFGGLQFWRGFGFLIFLFYTTSSIGYLRFPFNCAAISQENF